MATKVSKTYVRRRKGKREEQDEEAADFNGSQSCEGGRRSEFIIEDESASRLELDVAEALAEFWRTAHEQAQRGKFDVGLRWSRKRTRSSLVIKGSNLACNPKEEPEDAFSSAKKNRSSSAFGRDSSLSDRDEIDSTRVSKEYSHFELRAQSPTSPLPSSQLPCGRFLSFGSPGAKSAFQRVLPFVPLQRPCLLPVKSEIEDMPLEVPAGTPENVPVQRKTKQSKCRMAMAAVKMEYVEKQTMDVDDQKKAIIPDDLRVKSEVSPVSSLLVSTKPKSPLSDKEKEARRLRRIQANRESARQTIRKKQVVCQELMKKASSLTTENEGLKQKRDSLLQELFCLKGQNFHLKHQLEVGVAAKSGILAAELPLHTVSESVSVSPLQVPSLQYEGVSVHTFTWAMAAEGAAVVKQPYTFNSEDRALNASLTNTVPHQQGAVLPLNKETFGVRVQEQSVSHVFNDDVCSPSSMERCQKEISSSVLACTQSSAPQFEGHSPTTAFTDPDLADDQAQKSACQTPGHGNCAVSQPPSRVPCSSKTGLNTVPAGLVSYESTDPFWSLQIAQGIKGGYGHDGSRIGHFVRSHSQTNALMARNYFAAIAAAEARKKRKELTRHKFLRCRGLRPKAIVADKPKES